MSSSPTAQTPNAERNGLLLFAHGARDPQWAQPFEAVAQACRAQRGESVVALAYLEFMSPSLAQAGAALAAAGCQSVDIVPLFLGAGGHVRRDVPLQVAALQAQHPALHWRLRPSVGQHPDVVAAMAGAALAAAASADEVPFR